MTTKDNSGDPAAIPAAERYEFVERDEQEEASAEIDYQHLLNVTPEARELLEEEAQQAQNIVFYCQDCQKLCAATKKNGKKLKFFCPECQGDRIYFGSETGIRSYFHIAA